MSDPIVIELLSKAPIYIEPLAPGAPEVIALGTMVGPFGPVSLSTTTIAVSIDGQGTVIVPGVKAELPVNWTGRVVGWELIGDLAGNAVVDISVGDPINAIAFASITGGNKPTLTAVDAAAGDVAGWSPDLSPGDVLRYSVETLDTIRRLTVALFVERD